MAVTGVDGAPGAGKTAYAVQRMWQFRAQGEPIYSNTPLIDTRTRQEGRYKVPVDPALYGRSWATGYIRNVEDLIKLRRGKVLIDEADGWFGAVDWQRVTHAQRNFWTQHRKHGLDIWWVCTHFDRMMNVVRDITTTVHTVMGYRANLSEVTEWDPRDKGTSRERRSLRRYVHLGPSTWALYDSFTMIAGNGRDDGPALVRGEGAASVQFVGGGLRAWSRGVEQVGANLIRVTRYCEQTGIPYSWYEVFDPEQPHPLQIADEEDADGEILDVSHLSTAPPEQPHRQRRTRAAALVPA